MEKYTGLMSVYYKEKPIYFLESLESILKLNELPSQFILVEDGNLTDNLYNIIKLYKTKFIKEDIEYINIKNKTNIGLAKSLNKGIGLSKYDLIARFDSDDISRADRMDLTLRLFEKGIAVVGGNIVEMSDGIFLDKRAVPKKFEEIEKEIYFRNPINHMSVTFRKSIIEKVGCYDDVPFFEDYYLWIKLINNGYRIVNSDAVFVEANVDNDFFYRRSGMQYFKKELRFQKLLHSKSYISSKRFILNLVLRGVPRLLPKWILKKIYKRTRKSN